MPCTNPAFPSRASSPTVCLGCTRAVGSPNSELKFRSIQPQHFVLVLPHPSCRHTCGLVSELWVSSVIERRGIDLGARLTCAVLVENTCVLVSRPFLLLMSCSPCVEIIGRDGRQEVDVLQRKGDWGRELPRSIVMAMAKTEDFRVLVRGIK